MDPLGTQEAIDFKVFVEGLQEDTLIFLSLEGKESISEPFAFTVKVQSASADLDLGSFMGKTLSVTIKCGEHSRYFHGVIGKAVLLAAPSFKESSVEKALYEFWIFPEFWTLKFSKDCRIFQNKKAMDIVCDLLKEKGVKVQDKTIDPGFDPLIYCVQYNESIFDFISRLLESIGVFYFFTFSAKEHTMVLANDASLYEPYGGAEALLAGMEGEYDDFHRIKRLRLQTRLVTESFSHGSFDYEKPATQLLSSLDGSGAGILGKIYEYPGGFKTTDAGDRLANIYLQALEGDRKVFEGISSAFSLTAGCQFAVAGHSVDTFNASYAVVSVTHRWSRMMEEDGSELYQNTFVVIPKGVTYRPSRKTPKPHIYGAQTAIVTGQAGEEIWTDAYGRIKVKFHWDHLGASDEKSSCWVRVAQSWAGKGWGGLFIPRVGMEVVVQFMSGDPDQPLVTGVVYNGEALPPYLPDAPTKSTLKSNTSKGGEGFNEIRFEDNKDQEEIYLHAQKDLVAEILNDRKATIVGGNDTLEVQRGSRTTTIHQDETRTIEEGNERVTVAKGNYERKVQGNYTLSIEGDLNIKVTGEISFEGGKSYNLTLGENIQEKAGKEVSLTSGADMAMTSGGELKITSGKDWVGTSGMALKLSAAMDLESKAGMNLALEGGMNLDAKAGALSKIQAGAGAAIIAGGVLAFKGAMVKIN